MDWLTSKRHEIGKLTTTFHFSESLEAICRDILRQHELNHHLYLEGDAPLPVLLRVIADLEEKINSSQALDALWIIGGLDDPDGLFSGLSSRLTLTVESMVPNARNPEWLYRWGYICFRNGYLEKLARLFVDGRLDETDYRVLLLKGRLAIAAAEYEVALEILNELARTFSEAAHHRAGAYWRMGLRAEARTDFIRLIGEKYIPAMKDAVKFFLSFGEATRALEAAALVPGLSSGDPEARILLGASLLLAGQTEKGLKELQEVRNEIWNRAFPVKYDSLFRILNNYLEEGMFQAGSLAAQQEVTAQMASHPGFEPGNLPGFLQPFLSGPDQMALVTDHYFLNRLLREPDNRDLLLQYAKALTGINDPRGNWINDQLESAVPTALPADYQDSDAILIQWFGCIPAQATFMHGIPWSVTLSETNSWSGTRPGHWHYLLRELSLEGNGTTYAHWAKALLNLPMPQLTRLQFSQFNLDFTLLDTVGNFVALSGLTHFSLEECSVQYPAFLSFLAQDSLNLEVLSIKMTEFSHLLNTQPGLTELPEKFNSLDNLKELLLEDCGLNAEELPLLAKAKLRKLKSLSLAHNDLRGAEIESLGEASWFRKILSLDVSFTGLEAGFLELALENGKNLKILSALCEDEIPQMEALEAHPRFSQIKEIHL